MGLAICLGLSLLTQASKPEWRPSIRSQAEFDRLSGLTETPYKLAHVRFMIDRKQGNKIYYIDSRQDKHHRDFANQMYLSLEGDQKFFSENTLTDNRRFILGWVAYQTPVKRFTYEFWDGDMISAKLIQLTDQVVGKSFFVPVAFKPNSVRQENLSASLLIQRVLISEISRNQTYQPLNFGFAIGRLRIVKSEDEAADASPSDILVLNEAPAGLPPVAGLIFAHPSTPLSHLSLLARGWHIPSASIIGAMDQFKGLDGKWVAYRTEQGEFNLHPAEPDQLREWQARQVQRRAVMTPKCDLTVTRLASLADQRATDVRAYGAKSANLGEVMHGQVAGIIVPGGFTLPFSAYDSFVRANGLDKQIRTMLAEADFQSSVKVRWAKLDQLRNLFLAGKIDKTLAGQILEKAHKGFPGKGLFVRSSTNSEDLPQFSGAGLYTTVANVRDDEALLKAIRTVWASVWNDAAYAARERAGIDHEKVAMAVLIQEGVPSESSGVMFTANPFDSEDKTATFISAKRGLGMRVVDGHKVPEQIIYRADSNSVQVLTRSEDDSLLAFDPKGGLIEIPTPPERAVLTDDFVRRLAAAGLLIQRLFSGVAQDIEWAIAGGHVYIVQARPYMRQ